MSHLIFYPMVQVTKCVNMWKNEKRESKFRHEHPFTLVKANDKKR